MKFNIDLNTSELQAKRETFRNNAHAKRMSFRNESRVTRIPKPDISNNSTPRVLFKGAGKK